MYLIEGITYNPNTEGFDFNWTKDSPGDIVKLKLQSYNDYIATRSGASVYYAYKIDSTDKEVNDKLRQDIKYLKANQRDVDLMISKAITSFNALEPINKFDVIITPKSSSQVLSLLRNKLIAKAGPNTLNVTDGFVKDTLENVIFNQEKINKLPSGTREKVVKMLNKTFSKENPQVSKIPGQYRNLIIKFLSFNSTLSQRVFNAILDGKVLIVDDIMTTSLTVSNMTSLLLSSGASEVISFVLLTNNKKKKVVS